VTGAARGIGQACALALAQEGAHIAVCDVVMPEETVVQLQKLGRQALGLVMDVSARAQVAQAIEQVLGKWGKLDILVNNAGVCARVGLEELTDELYQRDLDVILRGTYLCTQLVYPHMKTAGYGKIVNISSVAGKMGGPSARPGANLVGRSGPAYAAAKGGVISFTKWVARDAGRYGICVNAICPGPIRTEMTRGFDYDITALPLNRWGEPEDIAQAVVFLASPASNFITGTTLYVDGGMVMD